MANFADVCYGVTVTVTVTVTFRLPGGTELVSD